MIRLKIALLTLGTVLGFASGFASLACHRHARRADFERHVAAVCTEATRAELARHPEGGPPAPPPRHFGYGRW
ncbi:MAG: hypothetical protein JNK72_15930 [Myxococcales bacterium]|nr:hypothetical protein [Myxococcales bacterium]